MQKSFSDLGYAAKKKLTRRDSFLAEIDSVTPWSKLDKLVESFYSKVEGAGRLQIGVPRMLRMYLAQQCFGLSDQGIEDAIFDNQSIRAFVGIDLGCESAPDSTTSLKFRHVLEANASRARSSRRSMRTWRKKVFNIVRASAQKYLRRADLQDSSHRAHKTLSQTPEAIVFALR